MKKKLIVFFMLTGVVFLLSAQDIVVTFVDGGLLVQDRGSWDDLYAGDSMDISSSIKVGANTIAELDGSGKKIVLRKQGVYKLSDLFKRAQKTASFGSSAVLKNFVTGANRIVSKTAAMGVRGDEAKSDTVEWLTDDDMVLSDAKEMIIKGDYDKALKLLTDNLSDVLDEELPEYNFYIGKSCYLGGKPAKALYYLSKVEDDPSADYYPDLVIMKGNLFIDSFSYDKALGVLDNYLKEDQTSQTAQAVMFLSARALNAKGDKNKSRGELESIVKLDASSSVGKAAKAILDSF